MNILFPPVRLLNQMSLILIPIALFWATHSELTNAQPTVQATNEGLYQVEIIIFKRGVNSEYADSERWRRDVVLRYPENYRQLITRTADGGPDPTTALNDPSYVYTIPKSEYTLGNLRYALQKDRAYQVLFHNAWQQNITEKNTPAVIIEGGINIGQHRELGQYRELEGSIQLRVSRYLHIETDLWLTRLSSTDNRDNLLNDSSNNSLTDNEWPTLPIPPVDRQSTTATNTLYPSSKYDFPAIEYIATFREKRRMRSEELHYIDHPILGLLIFITPIEEAN